MSSRDEGGVSAPSGLRVGERVPRSGARIGTEEARTQILRLLDARVSGDATARWFKHMPLVGAAVAMAAEAGLISLLTVVWAHSSSNPRPS